MEQIDFERVKATFPWRHQVVQTPARGLIQVFDRHNNEVPLFTMVAFLDMITAKLSVREPAKDAEPGQ